MDSTTVIPAGFHGAASRLTLGDIERVAAKLGIDNRLVEAVAYVESDNRGFLDDGRPELLFEAHQFHELTGGKWDQSHPGISAPTWPSPYGAAGAHQYDRLAEAMSLDHDAALQACTWGMFQELGRNYQSVGFATIDSFVAAMCVSEGQHIDTFAAHCLAFHLEGYLQARNWEAFASGYNGAGQVNFYASKLLEAWKAGKFPPVLDAPPPPLPLPAPPPPSPRPPPMPPVAIDVLIRPKTQRVFPGVTGVDQDNVPIDPTAGPLISSDPTIAVGEVDGPDAQGQYAIVISGASEGASTITGPGVSFAVTVEASALVALIVDASKAFTRPLMMAAALAMMLVPASVHELAPPAVPVAVVPARFAEPAGLQPALSEGERLCLADLRQPGFAIERCLQWVHSHGR